jgi:DNA-binding response OmpR family regulator
MSVFEKRRPSRILIIDDDIDLLMLLERRLLKEGYDIETAASLSEAEEIIPYFTPQLVLLDINVKGEDGRRLCWQLKKSETARPVTVLIMSGYDYSTGRALLFGADGLLPKPLNTEFLLHQVAFHLQQRAAQKAVKE